MTPARLYLRCLRWGLSTALVAGAVTGAAVGFFAGHDVLDGLTGDRPGLALVGTLFGSSSGFSSPSSPPSSGDWRWSSSSGTATLLPRRPRPSGAT